MNTKTYYEIETRWSDTPDKWDTANYDRIDEKYYKFSTLKEAKDIVNQYSQLDKEPRKGERYVLEYRIVKRTETVTIKDEAVINFPNPRAGRSEDDEWLKLREYDVYKKILNEEWNYSDFDCWLAARDTYYVKFGERGTLKALKEFQAMYDTKIKSTSR